MILLGPVALAQHEAETPAARDVKDRDVLGEPDRIVERREQRTRPDLDVAGSGNDERRHDERRRQPADRGIVMLLDIDDRESAGVGIRRHVERGGISVRLGPAIRGLPAHVESQDRPDTPHRPSQPRGVKRTGTRV